MPPTLAQILPLCDGSRTVAEIHTAVCEHLNIDIPYDTVVETIAKLDEAYLLENERFAQAQQEQVTAFRALPYRPAALANVSYAPTADALAQELTDYAAFDAAARQEWPAWHGRALISPHIDYQRGSAVYAQVWHRAQAAIDAAEVVLIFGTDHNGGAHFTLTRLAYATPFGVLPTDSELIDKLATAITPEQAYADEFHHKKEHSIELSAVWFHHLRRENPCPVIPILCGSFFDYLVYNTHPKDDPLITSFIETLQRETAGKKVLAVASVDLAHMGPAFDDDFAMDETQRTILRQSDHSLMEAIAQGDADRFYSEIANVRDENRICGFAPIYLMLRYLGAVKGEAIAYEQCPADPENQSLVSICGMLLS